MIYEGTQVSFVEDDLYYLIVESNKLADDYHPACTPMCEIVRSDIPILDNVGN
jgi:hypothetical protein